jgi:hypothetical protein
MSIKGVRCRTKRDPIESRAQAAAIASRVQKEHLLSSVPTAGGGIWLAGARRLSDLRNLGGAVESQARACCTRNSADRIEWQIGAARAWGGDEDKEKGHWQGSDQACHRAHNAGISVP